MKISAKGRYAVRAVINLSRSSREQKSVREIAKEESISSDFLEKIFSKLKKSGIIRTNKYFNIALYELSYVLSAHQPVTSLLRSVNSLSFKFDKKLYKSKSSSSLSMLKSSLTPIKPLNSLKILLTNLSIV